MKINCTTIAALLYSLATPLEIWAAIEYSKTSWIEGTILLIAGMIVTFFGIKAWISAQSKDLKKDGVR